MFAFRQADVEELKKCADYNSGRAARHSEDTVASAAMVAAEVFNPKKPKEQGSLEDMHL